MKRTKQYSQIHENVSVFLPQVSFKTSISFVHYFGIIIKVKCSPFYHDIIQPPIMSITPMTELSDPSSYVQLFKFWCQIVEQGLKLEFL